MRTVISSHRTGHGAVLGDRWATLPRTGKTHSTGGDMRVCAVEEGNPSGAAVVAGLGTFDGVHQAHRAMLVELSRVATDKDAQVGLLLIEGGAHYRARMLTSLEHRLELLDETGEVDAVWVIPADIHEQP